MKIREYDKDFSELMHQRTGDPGPWFKERLLTEEEREASLERWRNLMGMRGDTSCQT